MVRASVRGKKQTLNSRKEKGVSGLDRIRKGSQFGLTHACQLPPPFLPHLLDLGFLVSVSDELRQKTSASDRKACQRMDSESRDNPGTNARRLRGHERIT